LWVKVKGGVYEKFSRSGKQHNFDHHLDVWYGGGNSTLFSPLAIQPDVGNSDTGGNAPVAQEEPCVTSFEAQEIPDDGSWLEICWSDSSAPEQSIVTNLHVKYLVDHPDLSQLEVQLMRGKTSTAQALSGGDLVQDGNNFGKTTTLEAFNGTPAEGNWYFLIRDIVPGGAGKLQALTILPIYAPVGEASAMTSDNPDEVPASYRVPVDAVESTTPDSDPPKGQGKEPKTLQNIKSETFEGAFPNTGWELLDGYPGDGKEYLWNDRSYRPHTGIWAGWPAGGGANAIAPTASTTYPPNMSSWMFYGPFDLSNAASAEAVFWLWRQIETNYDYLFVGVSHDRNSTFTGYNYSGTAAWEEKHINMSSYLGDSSVWIAWRFYSDSSVQYAGPWVDDILIQKDVAGTVTVNGGLYYAGRDNSTMFGRYTKVALYENDPAGTDDLLFTRTTDIYGNFSFPTIINWDSDADADPGNRKLDLYVVFEADYYDSGASHHSVTDFSGQKYKWPSWINPNVADGSLPFLIFFQNNYPTLGAMWIFQDLQRAWEYIYLSTSPNIDPGSVTAKWENAEDCYLGNPDNCNAFFSPNNLYIFIPNNAIISADTVIHETGHHYMYNKTQWVQGCGSHTIFGPTNIHCA